MKKLTCIIFLCFFTKFAIAQTGEFKGIVKDSVSGFALEGATVTVRAKDSTLINYQLTDKFGGFNLIKLPVKKELHFNITYTGYKSHSARFIIDSLPYKIEISLAPYYNDSSNVTVTAYVPIRMNGDTIEINPAAFKLQPNAVVEDLLAQVPGITVWADGTVTMNGKKVPNILVDGKPFMGSNDARITTQNLSTEAVDKIQVYDEIDRSVKPQDRRPKDSIYTMNIKLKEDKKKGYFGKIGIGYGTQKRFENNLSFQMYNKKTSFGIGGGHNNINKNIENLTEMFQNNTYRNFNPNLYYVGNFDNEGISKNHSIGGVYTHNFTETSNSRQNDRITINYVKAGSKTYLVDQSLGNRSTGDNPQLVENTSTKNNWNNSHSLGLNYIKTNSYNDNFSITANASMSNADNDTKQTTNVRDTAQNIQSLNDVTTIEDNKSNNQSLSLNYSKTNSDNLLKSFDIDLNFNNSYSNNNRFVKSVFDSYINNNADTVYNRKYNIINNDLSIVSNINYNGLKRLLLGRYNLLGIDINFNNWFSYSKSNNTNAVFDIDSATNKYTVNNNLTYTNTNEKLEYTPYIKFTKSYNKCVGSPFLVRCESRFFF